MASRSFRVTAKTFSIWWEAFLAAAEVSLASKPTTGVVLQSKRFKARLGEMLLERELFEAKIALLEARDPCEMGIPVPICR